eukprot:SAG31_NODE_4642_length_3076_cov_76.513268_1_plen_91_part_00
MNDSFPILVNDFSMMVASVGARMLPTTVVASHSINIYGREVGITVKFVGDAIHEMDVNQQMQVLQSRERVYLDDVVDEVEEWRGPLAFFA